MSRIFRGLTALGTFVVLLVAVPYALLRFVGRPWPSEMPTLHTIWHSIARGDISDSTVIKALAIAVWISWARLAVSVLIELVARLARRPAPRVVALGSSQQWAGALVAAIVLLIGSMPRASASTTASPAARPIPAGLLVTDSTGGWFAQHESSNQESSNDSSPTLVTVLPSSHSVVVVRGDTLSGIAESEFGDERTWPTLWEANQGRSFGTRTFTDPNLILPGWELLIPDDTATAPVVESPIAPAIAPPVVQGAPPTDAGATPVPSTVLSTVPTNVPTPVPTTTVPTTVPAKAMPDLSIAEYDGGPSSSAIHDESSHGALAGGLGSAMLLAAGVVGGLAVRRRRQLRGAPVLARIPEPTRELVITETLLRGLDADSRIARLDIALRALAGELVELAPGAAVLAVLLGDDDAIEVLLTMPAPHAPAPWESIADDRWLLPAHVDLVSLSERSRRVSQPCPALVHLGCTPARSGTGQAQLFVDLEAMGLLAVDAAQPHAANVVRAIAAGVALSPLSEIAHLVTCGLTEAHLGRASFTAPTLDAALDLAAGVIGTTATTTSAALSTFTLRARNQGGEAWEPAIVVAAEGLERHAIGEVDDDLLRLTSVAGRGLAVVVDRAVVGARWRLEQLAHHWVLQPLGLVVTPVGVTTSDLAFVQALLDESDRPMLCPEPDDSGANGAINPSDAFVEPAWSLMVRLLGPVEVCDRAQRAAEFERSKALELVVWLSQHRERSTRTAARTALWELNVRDATFANVVSDSRRSLGRLVATGDSEGTEWILRTLTEQLPLHALVITDAELLAQRLDFARAQQPVDAIETLRPGLSLVRDGAFFGTSYLWPDAEGITTRLTLLVTSAASVLASHYLSLGDTDGVFWATGQGLRALAGHEELIALRMRAHAVHGDLAGVRQEWESYERALIADPWSSGDPSPKLVNLRRELLSLTLLHA